MPDEIDLNEMEDYAIDKAWQDIRRQWSKVKETIPNHLPTMKSLRSKGAGTCKPGQRADLTHCTPINPDSKVEESTGEWQEYGIPSEASQVAAYRAGYLLHATKRDRLDSILRDGLGTAWFSSTEEDAGDQPGNVLLALHRDSIPKTDKYGDPSISPHSGYYINDPELGDPPISVDQLFIFRGDRLIPLETLRKTSTIPNHLPMTKSLVLKESGHWVTLEDSGTHVFLEGGKVTAGPAALTGKPINRLSDKKKKPEEEAPKKPSQEGSKEPPQEKPNGREEGERTGSEEAPKTSGSVAQEASRPQPAKPDQSGDSENQSVSQPTAQRIPASLPQVNKRLDRMEKFFRGKGQHEAADWMAKLKDHVNTVGTEESLKALGESQGQGGGGEVQYEGGWDSMSHFASTYLEHNGIIMVDTPPDATVPLVSSRSPSFGGTSRTQAGDYTPRDPTLRNKLEEAQSLPGLEKSEDISKLVGAPVTHLTPDVLSKLDATYGKGQWIVKPYGDEAYSSQGVYFPQRAEQIKQDAKNMIWMAGEHVAQHGFQLARGKEGKHVAGLIHSSGDIYPFGSKEYEDTIQGEVREWADKAQQASASEQAAALPFGGKEMMAQPAFAAVGVSDAERAAGKTIAPGEARIHIITRNGKAEIVPHSTWIKGEQLPVVFESEDSKAMAKAAMDAINALPKSERQGQIYAPDVIKAKEGYKVVEANPANDTGSSGYLGDNPLIIDSYVSHLTGRDPAHVRFIRDILSKHKKADKPLPNRLPKQLRKGKGAIKSARRKSNADANFWKEIGGYRGAVRLRGRWVGFRDQRKIDLHNLLGEIRGWQGPPSQAIINAVDHPQLGLESDPYRDRTKGAGTCKPGQRADLTHCTPASGESSAGAGGSEEGGESVPSQKVPPKPSEEREHHDKPKSKLPHFAPPPKGEKITKVPCCLYRPDPTKDLTGDGVADFARVGVPGMSAPPPPKEIPRLPNLTEKERAAETRFAEAYLKDPDGMAREYRQKQNNVVGKDDKGNPIYELGDAPHIFSTDDAKMLSPDYNPHGQGEDAGKDAKGTYNVVVHQTANALAKRAFRQYLDEVVSKLPKERQKVLATAGGVAAGKGYALKNIPETKDLMGSVGAVWDAAGEANSTENPWVLQECRKRGLKCVFAFIHADPVNTWENPKRGVIERAGKVGRMVDHTVFADSYAHGPKSFHAFMQNNIETRGVDFHVIDNSTGGAPESLEAMPHAALTVDGDALQKRCYEVLQDNKEKLKPAVYRGGTIGARIWGFPSGTTEKHSSQSVRKLYKGIYTKKGKDSVPDDDADEKEFREWSQKIKDAMVKNLEENSKHADEIDEADYQKSLNVEPSKLVRGVSKEADKTLPNRLPKSGK